MRIIYTHSGAAMELLLTMGERTGMYARSQKHAISIPRSTSIGQVQAVLARKGFAVHHYEPIDKYGIVRRDSEYYADRKRRAAELRVSRDAMKLRRSDRTLFVSSRPNMAAYGNALESVRTRMITMTDRQDAWLRDREYYERKHKELCDVRRARADQARYRRQVTVALTRIAFAPGHEHYDPHPEDIVEAERLVYASWRIVNYDQRIHEKIVKAARNVYVAACKSGDLPMEGMAWDAHLRAMRRGRAPVHSGAYEYGQAGA